MDTSGARSTSSAFDHDPTTTITDAAAARFLRLLRFLRLDLSHWEANQTVQRTGASRHAEWRCGGPGWLAPVADLAVRKTKFMKSKIRRAGRKILRWLGVSKEALHEYDVAGHNVRFYGGARPRFSISEPVVINGLSIYCWDARVEVSIGRFSSIANDVKIIAGGEHRTHWVTTFAFIENWNMSHLKHRLEAKWKGPVRIGNDVWIGNGATIISGVTIGDGAVVGAGAIVVKDVAPYTIVGGCPAKPIRMRFDEATVKKLLAIRWWDWSIEKIMNSAEDLIDTPNFVEKYASSNVSMESTATTVTPVVDSHGAPSSTIAHH